MDGLKEAFGNKYVLIGGAVIGAVLLFSQYRSSAAGAGAGQAYNNSAVSGVSPYSSSVMAYNAVATQEVTKQAAIAANVAIERSKNDVALKVATLNTIAVFDSNQSAVMKQSLVSEQGILTSQIQANANVTIDLANNGARMYQAQQQTQQTFLTTNAQVAVAHEQAKAAKTAATMGMIGNVAGAVAKTATAFIKA